MVFEWFFKKKDSATVFPKFMEHLNALDVVENEIDNLLSDKKPDPQIREKIAHERQQFSGLFRDFASRLEKEKDALQLYILTSEKEIDYLTLIKELTSELLTLNNGMQLCFREKNDISFLECIQKAQLDIKVKIKELELLVKNFQDQSKHSLHWMCKPGIPDVIPTSQFKKTMSLLGGIFQQRRGSHFAYRFKNFEIGAGPSRKNANAIAGNLIRDEFERHATFIQSNLNQYHIQIPIDQFLMYIRYFVFADDREFEKLFIHKYLTIFAAD